MTDDYIDDLDEATIRFQGIQRRNWNCSRRLAAPRELVSCEWAGQIRNFMLYLLEFLFSSHISPHTEPTPEAFESTSRGT
jgi:hypothetical protein